MDTLHSSIGHISLYKRTEAHSQACLAKCEKKLAQMNSRQRSKYLAREIRCGCHWHMRGVNRWGEIIKRQSTERELLSDAQEVADKAYNTPLHQKPAEEVMTLEQSLEKWIELKLKHGPISTQDNYVQTARELIAFLQKGEDRPVYWDEFTLSALAELQAHWMSRVENTTNNKYRTNLRAFFNFFLKKDQTLGRDGKLIASNPVKKLDPLPAQAQQTLPIDTLPGDPNWKLIQAEFPAFIAARRSEKPVTIQKHPENFLGLLCLMYWTGLRVSDAVKFIPALLVPAGRGWKYTTVQKKTQKRGGRVTCYLTHEQAARLRALPLLFDRYPFWSGEEEEHYINNEIRKPLEVFGQKTGINDQVHIVDGKEVKNTLRPHRFRDSFACNQINADCPIDELSKLLGHKAIKTTEQHYLPWIEGREKRMEEAFFQREERRQGNVIEMPARLAS